MCGITGIANFDGRPADASVLHGMTSALSHRGPDDGGVYISANIGLGHRRLSIIDCAGGRQPMHDSRGLSITFNGEIFNYVELRAELERHGERFVTQSDTEVVLRAYGRYGEDCVHRFNGQWAFAIWDANERKLFISRDRLGVRPLFYYVTTDSFLFASEVKALFAHPDVERSLDLDALDELFTFWTTLPPRTMFKGVYELPPGNSLVLCGRDLRIRRYWELSYEPVDENLERVQQCAETLLELLFDATRIRLRADVPVGAHLSGGLDSSLVTALAARLTGALKTFSIGFDDPEFDESRFQSTVSDELHTQHHQIRCSSKEIVTAFPDVVYHAEKPILRTAPAPLLLLSRLIHEQGYKVVVTGEGADEMFGGYDIFKEVKIRQFCAAQPNSQYRMLLLRRLYPYLPDMQRQPTPYLKAFFRLEPQHLTSPFFSHLPRWKMTSGLKLLFSDDVKQYLQKADVYARLESMLPNSYFGWDAFTRAQYLETNVLLPGYILSSQGDRMAMAHSVEGRFPFLDHRVVAFASRLPSTLKMKVLKEKFLLSLYAKNLVPGTVLARKKQPYRAPGAKAFFDSGSPPYVQDMLSDATIRKWGIFDPQAICNLMKKIYAADAIGTREDMAVVGVLSTQLLNDRFISCA